MTESKTNRGGMYEIQEPVLFAEECFQRFSMSTTSPTQPHFNQEDYFVIAQYMGKIKKIISHRGHRVHKGLEN